MPRESAIVARILRRLRSAGAFAEKNHGTAATRIGTPDIYACLDGRFIAIEVKQPGKKPSPAQARVLVEIAEAGGIALVMDDPDQVDKLLHEEFNRG